MFCARFISGSSDFTPFIHFRYFLLEISIHKADACILAMSCVGYACVAKNLFEAPYKKDCICNYKYGVQQTQTSSVMA